MIWTIQIFLVLKLMKVMKQIPGIQRLFSTIIVSLPSLVNASSLLFLAYFIFAVLGCNLFDYLTFLNPDKRCYSNKSLQVISSN